MLNIFLQTVQNSWKKIPSNQFYVTIKVVNKLKQMFVVLCQLLNKQLLHNHNLFPLLANLSNKVSVQSLWNKHHNHHHNHHNHNNHNNHNNSRLSLKTNNVPDIILIDFMKNYSFLRNKHWTRNQIFFSFCSPCFNMKNHFVTCLVELLGSLESNCDKCKIK